MMRKLPSISISNTRRTQRAGEEYMKLFLAGKKVGGTSESLCIWVSRWLKELGPDKKRLPLEQRRCGCWNCGNKEVPLEVNHKNGNPYDHHVDNLEALCKACHHKHSIENSLFHKMEGGRSRLFTEDGKGYKVYPPLVEQEKRIKEAWEARNTGILYEDALPPWANCHGYIREIKEDKNGKS